MDEIIIKQVTPDEIDLLVSWRETVIREVFELGADADVSALVAANRAYYEEHIPDGTHIACFAREGGVIVGCGSICLHDELPSPDNPTGKCAYFMNIFTVPVARGKGVAKKVTAWLIAKTRELGITKVYLETTEMARSLYIRQGFVPMVDYLILSQDDKD